MAENGTEKIRVDKWLWAVRRFKTRALAAEACGAGNVTVGGRRVKGSRGVGPGEVVCVREPGLTRRFRVLGLTGKRVGAPRVPEFLEEVTPAAELARREEERKAVKPFARSKGMGRPTKRERRILDALRDLD